MSAASVNIFVPTYEPQAAYLHAALESIRKQTVEDWTVFIHDDASSVDVAAMIAPYLSDTRFRFERSPKRLGIGGNWNACLRSADAPFVQFLFQDDEWHPDYLQKSLEAMSNENVGFTAANHGYTVEADSEGSQNFYGEIRTVRESMTPGHRDRKTFLEWWLQRGLHPNVIGEPSFVLLRRSLTDQVGPFHEDMQQGLDLEYWLRCLLISDVAYLPQILGAFRVHAAAASAQNDRMGRGLYDRLWCFDLLLRKLPSGDLKRLTQSVLRRELSLMIRKFFTRVGGGKQVSRGGSRVIVQLALRHPLLMTEALVSSLRKD